MHDKTYDPFMQNQRYQYNYHPPYCNTTFGKIYQDPTSLRLQHFTQVYRSKVGTEWCPVGPLKRLPIRAIQPMDIYYGNIGLLPNYTGHVPGMMFRFGKTYGEDTKDAKAWLRLSLLTKYI